MSLVAVVDVFLDAQTLQCEHTTDTQQNLLLQTVFPVASIELVSNATIELAVQLIICIKQIERDAAYIDTPQVSMNGEVHVRHIDHHMIAILIEHWVDRQLAKVLSFVVGYLLAVHRQALSEIAIAIEETHGHHIYIAVGCFLQIVTSKHAQTT